MSTDTTHKVTFSGGDAKARLAAAAYVHILSTPWQDGWHETRRSIKVGVFRNESKCDEFLDPYDLCAQAAMLFPGVSVDYRSENEYGEKIKSSWCEAGEPAIDPIEKAADAILAVLVKELKGAGRYNWLAELVGWVKKMGLRGPMLGRVNRAWQHVRKLKARDDAFATKRLNISVARAVR